MSTLVKMIFSLPESVIQAMAGKKTEVDGSILDPRIALMAKQAARQASMTVMPVSVARKGTQAALSLTMGKRRARLTIRDMKVPGGRLPDGRPAQLEARLYTPPGANGSEPLLVYLH